MEIKHKKAFVYSKWAVTSALFFRGICFGGQSDCFHGGNIRRTERFASFRCQKILSGDSDYEWFHSRWWSVRRMPVFH